MKWFKPKYTVCTQCSMLFEPTEGPFPDLCPTHRKPVMEKAERRERVIAWAMNNWEKLEEQMNADYAKQNQTSQEYFKEMAKGLQSQNPLSGIFGLSTPGRYTGLGWRPGLWKK